MFHNTCHCSQMKHYTDKVSLLNLYTQNNHYLTTEDNFISNVFTIAR
jgi:hypothetical protein